MAARKALGKGLGALIPTDPIAESAGASTIPINKISPNPLQPRIEMDKDALSELAKSIAENGVLLPILVRPAGNGEYELVAGERRFRAATIAGLKEIPAVIRDVADDMLLPLALIENLQREDLNPIDEALAYKRLSNEMGFSHDKIAKAVSKSRTTITNSMRILKLPDEVQQLILIGDLTAGQARPLLALPEAKDQIEFAHQIIENGYNSRMVERFIADITTVPTDTVTEPPPNKKLPKNEYILDIERRLESLLGTKISVVGDAREGKIIINFYSSTELERLLETLGVGE